MISMPAAVHMGMTGAFRTKTGFKPVLHVHAYVRLQKKMWRLTFLIQLGKLNRQDASWVNGVEINLNSV